VAVACFSLEVSVDPTTTEVFLNPGTVAIADMSHFFSILGTTTVPSYAGEEFTANMYNPTFLLDVDTLLTGIDMATLLIVVYGKIRSTIFRRQETHMTLVSLMSFMERTSGYMTSLKLLQLCTVAIRYQACHRKSTPIEQSTQRIPANLIQSIQLLVMDQAT
jgi:predicted Na+-dependent transporter